MSWIAGQYGLYGVDAAGEVHEKVYKSGWQKWSSLGHPTKAELVGPIAGVAWSTGRYGIYALGSDGAAWQKWWAPGGWSGWDSIGHPPGIQLRCLSSGSTAERRYAVAGVGSDANVWLKKYVGSSWHDWKNLGRPDNIKLNPVMAFWANGTDIFAVYARGSDDQIYCYNGSANDDGAWTAFYVD